MIVRSIKLFSFLLLLLMAYGVYASFVRSETRAAAPRLRPAAERADEIVILKGERRMILFRQGQEMKRYSIRLGSSPTGPKQQEGDGKTPEGRYLINRRNGASQFHLSLGITYPTAHQRREARARGVSPGGDIFIHGQPNAWGRLNLPISIPFDWTAGCIAVSDNDIEDVFSRVAIGTSVTIKP
ncbi:L,D-transpeptidase family protein [uncultured Cohaesibacter sp.]|uniref:L,D-transpeptidase family protein n=1 Tax=uncultured Cohaesibacter sp. TaxID=1002546 RepID=UPI00292DAE8A|nr:L,D-transpeptidase family protein [uncultured Cohaesibacter sp.]